MAPTKHFILTLLACGLCACSSEDHTAKADKILYAAEKLAEQGKIDDAEIRYDEAEKESTLSENIFALPRVIESRTKMELKNGKAAQAEATAGRLIAAYDKLISETSSESQKRTLNEDRARATMLEGDTKLAAGKAKDALALYEQAATDMNNMSANSMLLAGAGEKISSTRRQLGLLKSEPMLDSANAYFVFVQVYHRAKSELDKGHFGEARSKSRDAVSYAKVINDENKLALGEMRLAVTESLLGNKEECVRILKELPKEVTVQKLKPEEQAEFLCLSALFVADDKDAPDLINQAATANKGRTKEVLTRIPEWYALRKPKDSAPPQPVRRAGKFRKMLQQESAR